MSERTYTVTWGRLAYPETGIERCRGLTGRDAFARLIKALATNGPVVVHSITPEPPSGQAAVSGVAASNERGQA